VRTQCSRRCRAGIDVRAGRKRVAHRTLTVAAGGVRIVVVRVRTRARRLVVRADIRDDQGRRSLVQRNVRVRG
jgi:hypothetical protein